MTVLRNLWLTALAVTAFPAVAAAPVAGGVLFELDRTSWLAVVVAAVSAITTAFVVWRGPAPSAQPEATPAEIPDDYVRARTPDVPVTLADGSTARLRELAARRPILLLALSEGCGSCELTLSRVPVFREALPPVDVRLLLTRTPEHSRLTELAEPQSLHDSTGYVRGSIADWRTPTAVLLGADGMLAGGPVSGAEAIQSFVADIKAELQTAGLAP